MPAVGSANNQQGRVVTTYKSNVISSSFVRFVVMLGAVLMAVFPNVAIGQGVPKIDVAPSCRAAAKGYAGLTQEFDSCLRSEEAAREILVKGWNDFVAADRDSCHRLTSTGTPGTYTELLTCLEMRRDARALPSANEIRKAERPPRRTPSKGISDPDPPGAAR